MERTSTTWVKKKTKTLYSCPYLLLNIDRFSQFFHRHFSRKLGIKLLIKISPHLKCVATLPSEILMFANWVTFCQSLMVSVGVSKLWCTHLIFVNPGVKINGCCYHEVLVSQQLLPAIRQVSGDFFVLQVTTRQCTGAHGTWRETIKLLLRETPAFISVASE